MPECVSMQGNAAWRDAGMPLGCPLPASLGEITSFSKKPSFLGNHSKYVGNQQLRPRPRHGTKTKVAPHRHVAKARACSSQGQGSPYGQATKARVGNQDQGTQPRPRKLVPFFINTKARKYF